MSAAGSSCTHEAPPITLVSTQPSFKTEHSCCEAHHRFGRERCNFSAVTLLWLLLSRRVFYPKENLVHFTER